MSEAGFEPARPWTSNEPFVNVHVPMAISVAELSNLKEWYALKILN